VRDATIVIYPSDLSGSEVARTTTDTAGKFGVSALQPGNYKVLIDRDGWSEWAPGRITDPAKAVAYPVFAGRNTVAKSVVTAAGVIAGRVTGPAGGPAPGIAVTVDEMTTASSWDTTTAADGTYSVSLPPGTEYVVSFTNGELTQFSPRTLDRTQARHYTVRSGHITRLDERLLPPAILTGRLVDESGTPGAGARVDVGIVATAGEASTTTGPDGRYRLATMPPGDVVVGFTTTAGREQWAHQKTSANEADRITLSLGTVTTVDETLLPFTAVAGRACIEAGVHGQLANRGDHGVLRSSRLTPRSTA
jgi:protocatechuate 3,4-dioxygenase beta subunit